MCIFVRSRKHHSEYDLCCPVDSSSPIHVQCTCMYMFCIAYMYNVCTLHVDTPCVFNPDMSSSLEGGLGDVAIEVLHRLLSHLLLSSEEEVGLSKESIDAFVQTLRRGWCDGRGLGCGLHVRFYL